MKSEQSTQRYLDRRVGELVAEDYARAAVFTRAGIDFCCGGGRTMAEACEEAGTSPSTVVAALEALETVDSDRTASDPTSWSLGGLVTHIEEVHHAYVRRTVPVLKQWTTKIERVHGTSHPELLDLRALVRELADELLRHMEDEEATVFPHLVALDGAENDDIVGPAVSHSLVAALEEDHEHAGALARRIREVTGDFRPPADACSTYAATFALLNEFEADLHRHVHLENNVLFPRARAILAQGGDSGADAARTTEAPR